MIQHVNSCVPGSAGLGTPQQQAHMASPPDIKRITFSKNERFMVILTATHAVVLEVTSTAL